jgi:nucleoside-triphosphatase
MKSVYLLTGKPGTGKTSLIKQVISGMKGEPGGFYTEEIRSQGVRQGFSLVTLDGREVVLAHVNIRSPYRVSKYGVDIDSFDRVGVSALHLATQQSDLVIIDEIGKMELFSDDFKGIVSHIINSGKRILGTIMLNPDPWVDAIKRLPQVNLVTVTRTNNQDVLEKLRHWLEVIK